MPARRTYLLAPLLLLAGCGDDPAPPAAPPATQLEKDLNKVGAASAVGYDGAALQGDVRRTVEGVILFLPRQPIAVQVGVGSVPLP